MAPEYGATMGFFPVDAETLAYLRFTGRDAARVRLVEEYTKAQGIFRTDATPDPIYTDKLELDLATVEPTLAGPKRPQDRVPLRQSKASFEKSLEGTAQKHVAGEEQRRQVRAFERLRGHCGHHQLHEYFEPIADAGSRAAGEKGRRTRPA